MFDLVRYDRALKREPRAAMSRLRYISGEWISTLLTRNEYRLAQLFRCYCELRKHQIYIDFCIDLIISDYNFNVDKEIYYISCCQHFKLERRYFDRIQRPTLLWGFDQITQTPFKRTNYSPNLNKSSTTFASKSVILSALVSML